MAGYSVLFTPATTLVAQLAKARGEGRLDERLTHYAKPKLQIIDELGYLPFEADAAHLFFQLVSRRYERGAMLITSNRAVGEWVSVCGDPVVATAIPDRLLHHSHVITIQDDSYRLREKRRISHLQKTTATLSPQLSDKANSSGVSSSLCQGVSSECRWTTPASTTTRRPRPSTITIRPEAGDADERLQHSNAASSLGTIIAGTKAGSATAEDRFTSKGAPQDQQQRARDPEPRAVADTSRGPYRFSSTIRSFSSSDQRRRRPVSTISKR